MYIVALLIGLADCSHCVPGRGVDRAIHNNDNNNNNSSSNSNRTTSN